MSASTSTYIQAFLNKTPVTTTSLADTLLQRVGIKIPSAYKAPAEPQYTQVKELCRTLYAFEKAALSQIVDPIKIRALSNQITTLMNQLELETIRPKESGVDKDWIIFAPRITDLTKPIKMPALLVYRFGFVKDRSTTDPNYSVNNMGVVSEHAGQDSTERVVADLFLKNKSKFALLTVIKPHTVPNPAYDPNNDALQIKYFTDPAHSPTTIFKPMLESLLQELFREMPIMIMHGMGNPLGLEYQVLMGNCWYKYRADGWRSWANMLAISFAIEDYYTSEANRLADKPSPVVSNAGEIPNYVLKGGQTVPMSSTRGSGTNGALRYPFGVISSNVTGHIGYYAPDAFSQRIAPGYLPSDRMIHMELTGYIRDNAAATSENRDKLVKVVQRAIDMYRDYDPAIHDPHQLNKRFAGIAQNMKRYPELFTPTRIAMYKRNHQDQYAKDTLAYKTLFAASKELPPPLAINVTPKNTETKPSTSIMSTEPGEIPEQGKPLIFNKTKQKETIQATALTKEKSLMFSQATYEGITQIKAATKDKSFTFNEAKEKSTTQTNDSDQERKASVLKGP